MDLITRLIALAALIPATAGSTGPAGGIPGAPPAGPHDQIDGLYCAMRPHEICRLDHTVPVVQILRDHSEDDLPATREECLSTAAAERVCAEIPMQWPDLTSLSDTPWVETAPGVTCDQVGNALICTEDSTVGGDR